MRALVRGSAIGLIVGTSVLAQQEDKFTAKYLLPYCRDAISNKPPTMSSDAVMQGMCVGMVDAMDFLMSELPRKMKNTAVARLVMRRLSKRFRWRLNT
jgi:hypothetical protein